MERKFSRDMLCVLESQFVLIVKLQLRSDAAAMFLIPPNSISESAERRSYVEKDGVSDIA